MNFEILLDEKGVLITRLERPMKSGEFHVNDNGSHVWFVSDQTTYTEDDLKDIALAGMDFFEDFYKPVENTWIEITAWDGEEFSIYVQAEQSITYTAKDFIKH